MNRLLRCGLDFIWKVAIYAEHRFYVCKTFFLYKPFFRSIGSRSAIWSPVLISHPAGIKLGDSVIVRPGVRLELIKGKGASRYCPTLEIGKSSTLEQNVHIACAQRIVIGEHVTIAQRVGIFDIFHPYEDIEIPIADQDFKVKPVVIGDHCFIGMGAVIHPGVTIGRHCMIGANSVVTRDIPDYSVAVGVPARVVRSYNFSLQAWQDHK